MIPATDVVDDGSFPVGTCHCHPGRVTLPTSAKRGAGGGLPLLFSWNKFWRCKTRFGWFCFFPLLVLCKTGEVTIFGVTQGLWSFVISKNGCFAKAPVTIIRSRSVFGSGTVGY